jgi:hypothetical protein
MTLHTIPLNILLYEENFTFFFISVDFQFSNLQFKLQTYPLPFSFFVQDPYGQPYHLTGFPTSLGGPTTTVAAGPPPPRREEPRKSATKMSETSCESEYSDFSDGSSVRTETSDPERGGAHFASVRRQKRYSTRTSLEAHRGGQRWAGPILKVSRNILLKKVLCLMLAF